MGGEVCGMSDGEPPELEYGEGQTWPAVRLGRMETVKRNRGTWGHGKGSLFGEQEDSQRKHSRRILGWEVCLWKFLGKDPMVCGVDSGRKVS